MFRTSRRYLVRKIIKKIKAGQSNEILYSTDSVWKKYIRYFGEAFCPLVLS
uniref:Uncharacterized protein n=1 Tax=Klebsiella pneumoniae TaxID=573 RepID=A0A8B0SXE3_KLEPN|nr:hypothetical protein [Klebsiella pneumoniae]